MNMQLPTTEDVVGSASWFPDNLDIDRGTFGFVYTVRQTLSMQTFLDPRWNRAGLRRADVPISSVTATMADIPVPRLNFIWHTAFCCSTLISRCLDVEGINLSLKEPQVLIHLAEAKRAGQLTTYADLPDTVFRLLARNSSGESVLIKPTNAVNNLVPEATKATQGRMLFLYSSCKDFVVSIAKKGEMGRIFARKLFGLFAADGHSQAKWPWQTLFELSDLQIASLVWHMQIAEFRRSLDPARSASLDCNVFLANPRSVLERLIAFFDLKISESCIDEILKSPLFLQNAKSPEEAYSAERRAVESANIEKALGRELDTVVEWSYRACPETPRTDPLGLAL